MKLEIDISTIAKIREAADLLAHMARKPIDDMAKGCIKVWQPSSPSTFDYMMDLANDADVVLCTADQISAVMRDRDFNAVVSFRSGADPEIGVMGKLLGTPFVSIKSPTGQVLIEKAQQA